MFNTHFSHVSCYARNKSAILVLNKIKTIAGEAPVILTGDFNAQPTEEMYSTLTHNWEGYFPLWDSRYLPVTTSKASKQTFNGFNAEAPEVIIDHIFVNGFFDVKTFNTFGFTEDSMYLSDHNPIMAALTFRLKEKTGLGTAEKLMQSVPLPFINSKRLVFKDSVLVEINMQEPTTEVYYTHDGAQPDTEALLYRAPFYLKHSCTLKVRAFADGKNPSETSRRSFIKQSEKPFKLTEVVPTSSTDYSSPGYAALFDGLTGDIEDLKAGSWLGFNGSNVDFLFDLGKKTKLSTCYVSCLSDPGKWIISPSKIEVKVSNDGVGYSSVAQKDIIPSFEASQSQQQVHALQLKEKNARFLKLSVNNGGLLPKSHSADGNPSWLFIDEIVIQ